LALGLYIIRVHAATHNMSPICCYAAGRREGDNKRCFCPSVCLSVCLSVAYIANNSRTQRPSVPKFGMTVPDIMCDSHTSFMVKRSEVRVTDGRGRTVSAEPGSHAHCLFLPQYAMHNEDYIVARCPSVCPSVCHTPVLCRKFDTVKRVIKLFTVG